MKLSALTRAGLGLGLILAAGGAWSQASSGARPPPHSLSAPSKGSGVSDSVITARAKAALLGASHVKGNDVHVTTQGGVVTLTGHVSSTAEKQKAGDIVQGLNGVTAVQNNLAVSGAEK